MSQVGAATSAERVKGAVRVVLECSELPEFESLQRSLQHLEERVDTSIGNLWGSAQPFALAAIAARRAGPWLVITSTESEAESFASDLGSFGCKVTTFPARESYGQSNRASSDAEVIRRRLLVAQALAGRGAKQPHMLVASVLSLLQPIPSVKDLEKEFLTLRVGEVLDTEDLLRHLIKLGYTREPLSEAPGEISLRGDILDVFPFANKVPLRIELFEDEIESLRYFEPADQRSIESLKEVEVCLAADAGGIAAGDGLQAAQLMPPETVVVEVEPLRLDEKAEALRIQSPAYERASRVLTSTRADLRKLSLQSLPGEHISWDSRSIQALEVGMKQAASALRDTVKADSRMIVLCQTEAEAHRFMELIEEQGGVPGLEWRLGTVSKGFRLPAAGLLVVNHRELKGVIGVRGRATARQHHHRVKAIQSFFELKAGDLVVHAVHGLGRYRGLERMARGGGEEEHLHVEFGGQVSLFVPASRIDMVQRYIGSGGAGVKLDKIGATTFRKRKEKVQRGLFDLAADLLEVQAKRALRKREPWGGDMEMVHDLTGSFPYEDTVDQVKVTEELEGDLASEHPMDRLICGDVGFGKTELAVRAAFRVVNGGGQVAVLVPTTILAQQHYETFSERLADFPVIVETMSRYVTSMAAKDIAARTAAGQVDILIGTHRILSKDVKFKNLGMVVIDEEQRFGVQHKEHFKTLRSSIDILTMTATPIPRTLHMSLSGIRDISALTVAPEGRQEIDTVLAYSNDDEELRHALLREKNRGGQVYFLHNRVASIEAVTRRLKKLVPECSYAVGHGQMGSRELRAVMDTFTAGDADVLVATTIIENGIDIPTAGTILIDNADHFGLSELHQLRGRVGRGSNKAFCYLLVEKHKPLKDVARERLKALEEMNQLGAGFGISVKDLELRGAGNVLGAEQSGHITAVGYDMFCRLLKLTIERLQAGDTTEATWTGDEERQAGVELEMGLTAFLPADWIANEDARLELLRELSAARCDEDLEVVLAAMRDRFGRIPEEAECLLRQFRLKILLDPFRLRRIGWREDFYLVEYEDPVALAQWAAPLEGQGAELRRIRRGLAHLRIPAKHGTALKALVWLEDMMSKRPAILG